MTRHRRSARRAGPGALALFAALPGALACAPAKERGDGRPLDLVLVSLDTCRADRLVPWGGDPALAPALAAFASEAVVFEDCLAQSGLTAPSHMSLLTGHHVHRHGLLNNRGGIDPPYTLASLLAAAGWRTAAFTGHGSLQARHGAGHGFEVFESSDGELPWPYVRELAEVVPRGLAWLDAVEDAPAFLFLHAYDPHAPYWPEEPTRERYAGWYAGTFSPERLTHPNEYARALREGELGPAELRYVNALYDGELAEADRAFAELLDGLRARGRLERSVVVFTSDHGECLGEHAWVGHSAVWDEVLRVPLLVRFPGGRWAGRVPAPVQHVDVLPTLLSALGVPAPPGLQGENLLPLVRDGARGPATPDHERLRVARVGARNNQIALTVGERWRLVLREEDEPGKLRVLRLFDLAQDPAEARDLLATEDGRARATAILERYRAWREAGRADDRRFASRPREPSPDDDAEAELRALGYAGEEGG